MVGQMVGVGEQTGALDAMLGKIADFYEDEVDAAIADLLAMIEPALDCFLGITIGSIVISMYLPLFTLIGKLAFYGKLLNYAKSSHRRRNARS
jgi:type IV pilus assembly protein PilC